MNPQLSSLTIFFPFYNDAGTVKKMIDQAYKYGSKVTHDLEVIALHGGNSSDDTYQKILSAKKIYPTLKIIDKKNNIEGYAVIKHGLYSATKDFVFYTDGDAQYSLDDNFIELVKTQNDTNSDIVNGYKKDRKDNFFRIFFGFAYAILSKLVFKSPITDMDCDFRLIRTSVLKKFSLESKDASILPELILKLAINKASFSEIPVNHYSRRYGKSNYTAYSLFKEKLSGDFKLYLRMKKEIKSVDNNLLEFISSFLRQENFKFIKFSLVGASSVILHFLLFNLLLLTTKLNAGISTIISDQIPILTSYYLNHTYTFKTRVKINPNNEKHILRFMKYWTIIMLSTVLQTIVVIIGVYVFGDSIFVANVAFIIGMLIAMIWNYYFHSTKVWKTTTYKSL